MPKRPVLFVLLCAAVAVATYYYYQQPGWPDLRGMLASIQEVGSEAAPTQAPPAPPPSPPQVAVTEVQPAEIPLPGTFSGRVAGFRDVEIRPQVSGILLERAYHEGSRVEQGQVLFRIDPHPYQATLDRAKAQLAQAQATLHQAQDNFNRIDELARRQVGTEKQRDDARSALDQTRAGVQLAQAEVRTAELNVSYTTVSAPVAGITSLQSPPVGTLIQAQQSLLTTITQLDPAYVNFFVTDTEYQAFRVLNEARAAPINERDLTVELHYGDGSVYPQRGTIDVRASAIDPRTGTIQVRAIFPNANGGLLPGQFVRVIVRGVTLANAIVLPREAVSQGPQGPFVYVVGANDMAQARPVKLGQEVEQGWVIQAGLEPGEQVVVDGIIRVRPGAPVKPVRSSGERPAAQPAIAEGDRR